MTDLGAASRFATYDRESNALIVQLAQREDLGYWRIVVYFEETSNDGKVFFFEKQFYLIVLERRPDGGGNSNGYNDLGWSEGNYLRRESLYRETDQDLKGRPIPFVYNMDAEGHLYIGWTT